MSDKNHQNDEQRGVAVKERTKTKRPKLYKVLLHNDDFTTMEFVIEILTRFFNKERTDAMRVMLLVHHTGAGVAGVYTHEIAETKVAIVTEYAEKHEHPLKVSMEAD
ncbi:MAG TPA: ATP-dependent Clp protease adapter ClpS [Myxococcales bacterium]|nr:ATP-dependent Clp protease adapter ClpS [Myxococcales bacterium]HIN86313.1 ATP-dependent Clp protease adapter ClpS [Myxococcales bacterium]